MSPAESNANQSRLQVTATSEFQRDNATSYAEDSYEQKHVELMSQMITKYSVVGLSTVEQAIPKQGSRPWSLEHVVLLSGSTGNLGSHILALLARDRRIQKIYAVNRPQVGKSIITRHEEKFEDQGLDLSVLSDEKVVLLECDLSKEHLGLGPVLYNKIRDSVSVVIHSAWRVNLRAPLESFEPNFRGLSNLIELVKSSPHFLRNKNSVKMMFTSSNSCAQNWDKSLGPYPEELIHDPKHAVGSGYGESKYVAEQILGRSGLNATTLRVEQLCGGKPKGAWSIKEWVPCLIKSCIAMGIVPLKPGVISWVPMETAARTIVDLAYFEGQYPPALNLVHPLPTDWNKIVMYFDDALLGRRLISKPLRTVSFQTWMDAVDMNAASTSKETATNIPAVQWPQNLRQLICDSIISPSDRGSKVGLPAFLNDKIRSISKTMRDLEPLNCGDTERWIDYWIRAGLFEVLVTPSFPPGPQYLSRL